MALRSKSSPLVEIYMKTTGKWQETAEQLRTILLGSGLTEELKWGKPCYTFEGKNIAIIQPFKSYCALLFFKGALLSNTEKLLVKTGENTQAGRQARFTDPQQVVDSASILRSCISEAIAAEKAGLKINIPAPEEKSLPEELLLRMEEDPTLKNAFFNLTPGRQRAYCIHFSSPKQSVTRMNRIEKYRTHILNGKGINDR